MKYPQNFIDKAKRVYPNWQRLHELLDKGSEFVGRLLADSRPDGGISIAQVLNAETLEELQDFARNEQAKSELYSEWFVLYREHRENYNAQVLNDIAAAHARGERLT